LLRTGNGVSGFQASGDTGIVIRFQQVQIEGVNLGHRRMSVECGPQIVVFRLIGALLNFELVAFRVHEPGGPSEGRRFRGCGALMLSAYVPGGQQ